MITLKSDTFAGIFPRTKENTYYGYQVSENFYEWYKTKATVKKHLKGTKQQFHRGTLIKGKMYINLTYQTLTRW